MDVSVIIVHYKTLSLTIDCIHSLIEKSKNISYEVIVVDNASNDGSAEELQKKFPHIRVIINSENLGFGRANNIGIKAAQGDFLFLLNSDTVILDNILSRFLEIYYSFQIEKIGVLGTLMLDRNGIDNYSNSYGQFPNIWRFFRDLICGFCGFCGRRFTNVRSLLTSNKNVEVDFVVGADMFIPKKVIDEIGMFDPCFFMYWEEVDLQRRMQKAGYKRYIIPYGKIIHLEGSTTSQSPTLARAKMYDSSLCYYFEKHNTWMETFILKLYFKCHCLKYFICYSKSEVKDYWKTVFK